MLLLASIIIAAIASTDIPRDLRRGVIRHVCLAGNDPADCPPSAAELDRRAAVRVRRAALRDSDHDGVPDQLERRYGTNPHESDTDGDGIGDATEIRKGTARTGSQGSAGNGVVAFAARSPLSAIKLNGSGGLHGRRIDTSNYQRSTYKRMYEGKEPLKYQYKIPNIQGRRQGKLRVSMFISECHPAHFGGGDCRDFDSTFASAKTRVTFVFDFKSDVLTVLINPSCSTEPIRGGCSSPLKPDLGPKDEGTIGGQLGSGVLNVYSGASGTGTRAELGVEYALKNSRFIPKTASPAIDGSLTLNGYTDSRGRRQIALNWSNDAYPSLEAYYEPGGKNNSPQTVCRSREESIDDLAGANRTRCKASF